MASKRPLVNYAGTAQELAPGDIVAEAFNTPDVFADFVVSGLLSPTSANLTSTLSAGVAYVIGRRVVVAATANTYTASQDTYVDLSNTGVLTYVAVANAAAEPALTANSLRLQKVVTDATAVTSVVQLASTKPIVASEHLRLGLAGVRLKNSAGELAVRNAGDTADAKVQVADGTAANHAVSKGQLGGATGSSLIGFLQAGTGAVATTVQAALRESASVKHFGAVGDGAANDTAALKAAIDAVSAAGGGVVRIPRGTYKHTGLTLPANITLQGEGYLVTVLDYTTATGDGITLASGVRQVSILDLKLHSSGASTGWAISGTAGVIGEFTINRYFITGFLKGVDIWQAINSNIGIGRMQGQGKTVAGGVGLRLGNSSTEISTTVTVGQTYFSNYETNTHNVYCPGLLCIGTVWETSKTAFKTAQHTYLYNCYWEANDTYDIDAAGDGVVVFGDYGLDMAKVLLDGAATARSLFHRRGGSYHTKERFLFGPNGDFGGALRATLADGTGTSLRISVSNNAKTGTGDDVHWESLSPDGRQYWWSKTLRFMEFDGTNFSVINPFKIGGGAPITKHLSATAAWDPASVADAAMTSTTVAVTGAAIGDTVAVGFSVAVPAGALLVGAVTAVDVVTVTLFNKTGAALDLASGTLRADVWKH